MTMKKMIIDSSHSEVGFKVKHLMISSVKGIFGKLSGNAEGDVAKNININFSLETASVSTNDEGRDGHLKGADFFDVENYPTIDFVAQGANPDNGVISGNLTIKGVTKEVMFSCDYNGFGVDPWGNKKHGFEVRGKINRSDFGLTWNAPLEAGGVLVSDEVKLTADLQLIEVAE